MNGITASVEEKLLLKKSGSFFLVSFKNHFNCRLTNKEIGHSNGVGFIKFLVH